MFFADFSSDGRLIVCMHNFVVHVCSYKGLPSITLGITLVLSFRNILNEIGFESLFDYF